MFSSGAVLHNVNLVDIILDYIGLPLCLPFICSSRYILEAFRRKKVALVSQESSFCTRIQLIKWAVEMGCPLYNDDRLCKYAAKYGHLEIMKWARQQQCQWSSRVLIAAIRSGNLRTVIWLRNQSPPCPGWQSAYCCLAAVEERNIYMIKYLRSLCPPCEWNESCCRAASRNGDIAMIIWLRSQTPPCPFDEMTAMYAAAQGNIEMLVTLRRHLRPPCPWDSAVFRAAVSQARIRIELLEWLRDESDCCPWDESVCRAASQNNQIEVLNWLRNSESEPCPWDSSACVVAAHHGHLHTLQWLRDNGCPWNSRVSVEASAKGMMLQ